MARSKKTVDEKFYAPFPARLRKLMEERGEKQENIASIVKKSRQTVSQYCNGVSEPGYDTLAQIAEYYDVSVDYLLGLSDVKSRNTTIREIEQYTGLSEESIKILHGIREICDFQRLTKAADDEVDLLKKECCEMEQYYLRRFEEDKEFKNDFSCRFGKDDLHELAKTAAYAGYDENKAAILSDMALEESLKMNAINTLLTNETGLDILKNISIFLFSNDDKNSSVSFVIAERNGGGGVGIELGMDYMISGMLSRIEFGLQKLRDQVQKKYLLCDVEGIKHEEDESDCEGDSYGSH